MTYQMLLADPPWAYENWKFAANGAQKAHYKGLSIDDICALPVSEVVADHSLLFLWVTGPKIIENAHTRVCEAWGFRPATILFSWVKTYRAPLVVALEEENDRKVFADACNVNREIFRGVPVAQVIPGNWMHGNGFYSASGTEFLFIGVRGKTLPRTKLSVKQILVAPRTEHSAKPSYEVRRRLRVLFPEYDSYNKLELFARPPVPEGWDVLGNEIDGRDIREALPALIQEKKCQH